MMGTLSGSPGLPRALNAPMSVVCLDRLGQPEVIGAIGCELDVVFHLETYYHRTL